jgi:hypothetical protein
MTSRVPGAADPPQGRQRPGPRGQGWGSHSDKRLKNILENYPRDELFQIDENELLDIALGHPAPARPAADQDLHAQGSVRPLRLGAGLHPARALRRLGP